MFNVRLLGMRAQNKPLYAFQACIFDENSQTRFAQKNEAALYNHYSETRNLIGQYPCRMRQSCTGNLRVDIAGRIYQILMGLNCRQKTFKLLKLTENEDKVKY